MKNITHFTMGLLIAATLTFTATTRRASAEAAHASLVAHEWGTFTSVQGADGIQLDWNPFQVWDLPNFVYDLHPLQPWPLRLNETLSPKGIS